MISSVVVPLDGSRLAEAAIPTARWLARSARSGLHLLHVRPQDGEPAAAATYLGDAAAAISSGGGPCTDFEVCDGAILEALRAGACAREANLVVMATRGRGDPGPLGQRSVAERLAACTAAPILVIKAGDRSMMPSEAAPLAKVLTAIDLERDPSPALQGLADFASLGQAHVTLLTVVPPPATDRSAHEARCREALLKLDAIADRLRALGARVAARVAVGADVASTILAEATRAKADVVVLRPRSSQPGSELLGRTTDAVIRRATTPVLVLPSGPGGA